MEVFIQKAELTKQDGTRRSYPKLLRILSCDISNALLSLAFLRLHKA